MSRDDRERRPHYESDMYDRPSRSGPPKLLITIVVLAVLVFVAVAALPGLRAGITGRLNALATVPTPTIAPTSTTVPTPTLVAVTAPGVLRRIESMRSLQTTIFRVDTVVRTQERDGKVLWVIPKQGQKLILFVSGKVTAGIDLNELTVGNVQVADDTHTIAITLPPAKILDAKLDSYTVETYDGSQPDKVSVEALQNGLTVGQRQIASTACESGLLGQATKDASQTFKDLFGLLDVPNYTVNVQSSSPAACSPNVQVVVTPTQ